MIYTAVLASAGDLSDNQIEALWIFLDGKGHSNRDISKKLHPNWGKKKSSCLSESRCFRDVITPLVKNGLIFSQERDGEKTSTGRHKEKAYYIKRDVLGLVLSVLKDRYPCNYFGCLSSIYSRHNGKIPSGEQEKYRDISKKFRTLAILEKEVDEYDNSLQCCRDHGLKEPDDPEGAGFRNGYLPPGEIYFVLGKDIKHKKLSVKW